MASKRQNMFQKNKTQETTENGKNYKVCRTCNRKKLTNYTYLFEARNVVQVLKPVRQEYQAGDDERVHKIIAISDGDNSSPSLNTGSEILLQVQPTASDKRIDSEYSNNLVNNTVTINSIEQHGSKDDSDNNKEMSYNEYLCTTARIHTFDKSDSNHIINTEQYISNMEKTKLSIEDDRVTEINHSELRNDFVTKKSCPETRHLEQLGDYPESNSKLKCINEVESNIVNEDVCNSQSVSDTTISEPTHEIENGENSSSFPRNNGFNLQVSEVRSDESSEEESYSNTRMPSADLNISVPISRFESADGVPTDNIHTNAGCRLCLNMLPAWEVKHWNPYSTTEDSALLTDWLRKPMCFKKHKKMACRRP
ncbi:hypothetical protein AAG570_000239 [Ranatra chinensis]|uniref:Uncharacterized protein n=1 Tax=Ranatra chinensis TaxID=642074 RepID=A0ABD0Z6Y6_9HEMI